MDKARTAKFLKLIAAQPMIGTRRALRDVGDTMTGPQFEEYLRRNPDFAEDYETARGRNPERIEKPLLDVALDPDHKHWPAAIRLVMQARHPAYGDKTRVELTGADGGPMEVTSPDVVAAAERFAALTDAAVRRAHPDGENEASTDPE